jgi:hypothetical protein
VYIPQTNAIRISDTIAWLPTALRMPGSSSTELVFIAITELTRAIKELEKDTSISPRHTTYSEPNFNSYNCDSRIHRHVLNPKIK